MNKPIDSEELLNKAEILKWIEEESFPDTIDGYETDRSLIYVDDFKAKILSMQSQEKGEREVYYRKVSVKERYPKELGTYLTDIGLRKFDFLVDDHYQTTSMGRKFPQWWLEEISFEPPKPKMTIEECKDLIGKKYCYMNHDQYTCWDDLWQDCFSEKRMNQLDRAVNEAMKLYRNQ